MNDLKGRRVLIGSHFLRPGDKVDRQLKAAGLEVRYGLKRGSSESEIAEALADVDAAIVASTQINERTIAGNKRLRVIYRTGVGFDNIDVDVATRNGIAVCVTSGLNSNAVAEMAHFLMLASVRRVPENLRDYDTGGWTRWNGRELSRATVGIVGLGRIGRRLIELLSPYGVQVLAHDVAPDFEFAKEHGVSIVSPDLLLSQVDILSLHLALGPATKGWLSRERLARMKPTAHIVNTSRGEVIDEEALADALRGGQLAGAALDVTVDEPQPTDSVLRSLPNVLLTPHIGGSTVESRLLSGRRAVANILSGLRGEDMPDLINPEHAAFQGRDSDS